MSVKIRLSHVGRKHVPFYRIVAVDSRKKRDGAFLEDIGMYDGLKTRLVRFNEELFQKWVGNGAQPSDSALKIYRLFKKKGLEQAAPKPVKGQTAPAAKEPEATEAAPAVDAAAEETTNQAVEETPTADTTEKTEA